MGPLQEDFETTPKGYWEDRRSAQARPKKPLIIVIMIIVSVIISIVAVVSIVINLINIIVNLVGGVCGAARPAAVCLAHVFQGMQAFFSEALPDLFRPLQTYF